MRQDIPALIPADIPIETREFKIVDCWGSKPTYLAISTRLREKSARESAYYFRQYYPENPMELDMALEGLSEE